MIKNLISRYNILAIVLICVLHISCTKNKDSDNLPDSEITKIPDSEFERALIALGHDSGPIDGMVLTQNINTIKELDLSVLFITDLTGIEDFENLETLDCSNNLLTTLKLNNPALENLFFYNNPLTSVDFSSEINLKRITGSNVLFSELNLQNNSMIVDIFCNPCNISNLILSPSINLESLWINNSNITKIDLTSSTNIKFVNLSRNKLNEIDFSSNLMVEDIILNSNELETLDLSNNLNLRRLYCNSNKLQKINLKNENNSKMDSSRFEAKENPNLTCIQVDDVNEATEKWSSNVDNSDSFKTDCW